VVVRLPLPSLWRFGGGGRERQGREKGRGRIDEEHAGFFGWGVETVLQSQGQCLGPCCVYWLSIRVYVC